MAGALLLPSKCSSIAAAAGGGETPKAASSNDNLHNSSSSLSCKQPLTAGTLAVSSRVSKRCERVVTWLHLAPPWNPRGRRQRFSGPNKLRSDSLSASTSSAAALQTCALRHGDCASCFHTVSANLEDFDECGCLCEKEGDFSERKRGGGELVSTDAATTSGRRQVMVSAVLLSASMALMTKLEVASAAVTNGKLADSTTEFPLELYRDVKNGFTLLRPTSWNKVDKPGAVIFFEDPNSRSSNIGVTVAPVKIASLDNFGTVDDVARRLVKAERDKGSTKDVQVINQFEKMLRNDVRLYSLEYTLDTTRGGKHVLTSVTVAGYKLYVVSIVFAEDGLKAGPSALNDGLHQVLGSFDLLV